MKYGQKNIRLPVSNMDYGAQLHSGDANFIAKASVIYEEVEVYAKVQRTLDSEGKNYIPDQYSIARDLKHLGYLSGTPGYVIDVGNEWRLTTVYAAYLTLSLSKYRHFISHRHYEDGKFVGAYLIDYGECLYCEAKPVKQLLWHMSILNLHIKAEDWDALEAYRFKSQRV